MIATLISFVTLEAVQERSEVETSVPYKGFGILSRL
jgi:hypothetical protein